MKKLYFILVLALIAASCTRKIEDVFSESASERLNALEQECLDLLLSPENGWLIQYYPSSTRAYGGYTYAAIFDDSGNVTVASENASDPTATVTSHYSINTSNSVTLTFDTYNEYIHSLSDPDSSGSNSYGGDFEFAFVGGDTEMLTFRGIKTGNTIKFTALDTDIVTAISQIMDIKQVLQDNKIAMYETTAGTKLERKTKGYNFITYTPDSDDSYSTVTIPYAYSDNGMTFYEAVEIDGVTVQDFTWDEATRSFTSNEDGTFQLFGKIHDNYRDYSDYIGTYIFYYEDNGTSTYGRVRVTQNVSGSSYNISNFLGYTVVADYSPYGHYLTIYAQYVGMYYNTYYAWFCPMNSEGYLTWSTSAGVDLVNQSSSGMNITLNFEDDGSWGPDFLIYLFESDPPTSSSALGYQYRISPDNMVKD